MQVSKMIKILPLQLSFVLMIMCIYLLNRTIQRHITYHASTKQVCIISGIGAIILLMHQRIIKIVKIGSNIICVGKIIAIVKKVTKAMGI